MDFSAPSPASSSSESYSSYSPHEISSDLGLDPSDPLNLLLHSNSQNPNGTLSMDESSHESGSPPNWSQLSALWPDGDSGGQTKPYPDLMDFGDLASLPMDIDFNQSIAIEPSALHFDPMKFNFNTNYSYDTNIPLFTDYLAAPQLPSTNPLNPSSPAPGQRRLSISSSVSSSGASLSPVPESIPSPATAIENYQTYFATALANKATPICSNDPAADLAERVRQSAGIMLALPMGAQLQALEKGQQENSGSVSNNSPIIASKLPIPRLPRPASQSVKSTSTVSSAASTPPPSTPSPPPMSVQATPNISQTSLPRAKTNHTTIERRYRTNLNARIMSLRMAVPALRVVEDREGGKKKAPNKVLVSSDTTKLEGTDVVGAGGVIDVVDERGFVDGVKVARKCSKANVLGKAVEYIRVLKKRENRLKTEQAGLKTLVSGLVGGPALLKEWERAWKEQFGGEEKDEVEGDMGAEAYDDDSDEEQDDEEEGARKRKRSKAVPSPTSSKQEKEKKPIQEVNGAIPEKRKRGRPRKVIPVVPSAPPTPQDQLESSSAHSHEGGFPLQNGQKQGPQQYLLATFALFSFFNSPMRSPNSQPPSHVHTGTVLNGPVIVTDGRSWGVAEYIQMFHLLVSAVVLLSFIFSWGGFRFVGGRSSRSMFGRLLGVKAAKGTKMEWVKLGEECILAGSKKDVPLFTCIQIYSHISSWNGVNLQEMAIAAMVLCGAQGILGSLARMKARAVWATLQSRTQTRSDTSIYERMVLESMSVDEAITQFRDNRVRENLAVEEKGQSPMQLLGCALVKERIRRHLGLLFIASVQVGVEEEYEKDMAEQDPLVERQQIVEAAKELGGHVGELGRNLERVWKVSGDHQMDIGEEGQNEADREIAALLSALVLYRRVSLLVGKGASGLLSPPPSPGRKDISDVAVLRRVLGSRAFEEWGLLEDARDRAVDLVVELERKSVRLN